MRIVGLLIAIVLGIGAFIVTMKFTQKPQEEQVKVVEVPVVQVQEVPQVDILVARSTISVGTKVEAQHIDRQPWPSHLVLPDFIVSDGEKDTDITGMVTRGTFQAREPIIRTKLANPNDPSFLAAALEPGMRAVTISVDMLSSVGGFVFPGDRVDVLLNHQVETGYLKPTDERGREQESVVELLSANLKVIALDQQASIQDGQGPRVPSSITLEVNRQEAQKLKLAESLGRLTLALRSFDPEDPNKADDGQTTPVTKADITDIVPPSYFPILYKSNGYKTLVIDPFADGDDQLKNAEGDIKTQMKNHMKNLNATMPGLGGSSASAMAGSGESETKIKVVRGVSKEEVGVDRP